MIFSFIELLFGFALFIIYLALGNDANTFIIITNTYGIGQCTSLILAIPIIFLYSYTRKHKNNIYDIFIPIGGIAFTAFVYVEAIYEFIIDFVG